MILVKKTPPKINKTIKPPVKMTVENWRMRIK